MHRPLMNDDFTASCKVRPRFGAEIRDSNLAFEFPPNSGAHFLCTFAFFTCKFFLFGRKFKNGDYFKEWWRKRVVKRTNKCCSSSRTLFVLFSGINAGRDAWSQFFHWKEYFMSKKVRKIWNGRLSSRTSSFSSQTPIPFHSPINLVLSISLISSQNKLNFWCELQNGLQNFLWVGYSSQASKW